MRARKPRIVPRPTRQGLIEIGYCHNGTVRNEFLHSIIRTYIWDQGHAGRFAGLKEVAGPYIAASRNRIVEGFLAEDQADWLLFVDNDMVFDGDAMERLFQEAHPEQRPIVAGMYVTHMANQGQVRPLPTWTREENGRPLMQVMEIAEGEELEPLTSCGMGLTLIHRSVFEAVGEAHKADEWRWFAHDLRTWDEELGAKRCGEDVSFCLRASELGFPIWGAPHVRAAHVKTQVLTEADVLPALRIVSA